MQSKIAFPEYRDLSSYGVDGPDDTRLSLRASMLTIIAGCLSAWGLILGVLIAAI